MYSVPVGPASDILLNSVQHNRSLRAQRDVLKSLGYIDLVNRLEASDGVYSLENVMTVAPELRSRLDILALWFEPVEVRPQLFSMCLRLNEI